MVAGVCGRLDRLSGRERLVVDGRREGEWVPAQRRPRRDAGAADDALAGAQDEVALQLDAVLAVVLLRHVANDVVVRERVGWRALGPVGLGRDDVEAVETVGRGALEALVRERHPDLDAVRPDEFVAADPTGLLRGYVDTVAEPGPRGGRRGSEAERGRGQGHGGDAAEGQ